MKEFEINIKGRVQLVMFRDFAQRKARALGIVGFVKNERNGTVTVIAQGKDNKINDFIAILKKGSILSRVESVSIKQREGKDSFNNFTIIY